MSILDIKWYQWFLILGFPFMIGVLVGLGLDDWLSTRKHRRGE